MKLKISLISRLACVLLAVLAINLGACHRGGSGSDSSSSATGSAQ